MVNRKRVTMLKDSEPREGPIVYWMSRDQRSEDNWALLFAQEVALESRVPLAVIFCLVPEYLGATIRQYGFMVKGLKEVEERLAEKNIPFFLLTGTPEVEIPLFLESRKAGALVADFNPIRIKREWNRGVVEKIDIPLYEVDAHNIVPCRVASQKPEFGAYTIRPKIHRALPEFLTDFPPLEKHPYSCHDVVEKTDWDRAMKLCRVDRSVPEVDWLESGESAPGIIVMLTRFFLQLWKLREMKQQRMSDGEIATALRMSPYHLRALTSFLTQHTVREVEDALATLRSTDRAIKTGSDVSAEMDLMVYAIVRSRVLAETGGEARAVVA